MSVIITPLFEPTQLTGAAATYFTAQVATQISKMTVSNPSSTTSYTCTIYWVPSGGTAGPANAIVTTRAIQPLETWDVWPFIGHVLAAGDFISAFASTAAKLNFFASGTTVSG
jgi:hypothetical protein